MKIAVTGKGGVGKTTISGALARQLALKGREVVAIDADLNPNLGISLGLPPAAAEGIRPILNALIDIGYTHHDPKIPAEELLDRYGIAAPDGIVLVATGKVERPADSCLCCGSHSTTRAFFDELPDEGRIVLADLEAGMNDFVWTRPGPDDLVLAVSDGSAKAVEIARRAQALAEELGVRRIIGIANRAASEAEATALAELLDVEVLAVPEDPAVEKADNEARAPMDADPDSPAMVAVGDIADRVLALAALA